MMFVFAVFTKKKKPNERKKMKIIMEMINKQANIHTHIEFFSKRCVLSLRDGIGFLSAWNKNKSVQKERKHTNTHR